MRKLITACAAALIVVLPACASPVVGVGSPVAESEVVGTSNEVVLPADQIVFQVTYGSGFVPELTATLVSPALTIYGDGRVFTMEPDSWSTPPVLRTGTIDPAALRDFIQRIDTLEIFDESTDFGAPGVTDMGTTTVMVNGSTWDKSVNVYALESGFDEGLTNSQKQARADLGAVITEASALTTDLVESVPEALRAWDLGPIEAAGDDLPEWTGPALDEFSTAGVSSRECVGITEGIEKLYQAALTNEDAIWQTADGPHIIAVTPLLPNQSPCER